MDDVIQRAHDAGVHTMIIPGTDVKSSLRAIEIAEQHEGLYVAVGIHPHHVANYLSTSLQNPKPSYEEELAKIETLLAHPKVVAVGEVGVDKHVYEETVYHNYAISPEFVSLQRTVLKKQIQLALEFNKSLILHNRDAKEDLLQILRELWDPSLSNRTVFHCCEADQELLTFAKERKIMIGVDGDITYDRDKQEFIRHVPLSMLVLETDSPYLLPEPYRSQKAYPNEPCHISTIAQEVARVQNTDVNIVIEETTLNASRLFNISN